MKTQQFLLLSLFALLPIGYIVLEEKFFPNPSLQILPHQREFKVSAVKVLNGQDYEVLLELPNGTRQWLHAKLSKSVLSGSEDSIIEILNNSSEPVVLLKEKTSENDVWISDIVLTYEGKRVNLLDLLTEKQLVLY